MFKMFGRAAASFARGLRGNVDVVNAWRHAIGYRGYDILGAGGLVPGRQVLINMAEGTFYCRYEVKTELADGTSVSRRNAGVRVITECTRADCVFGGAGGRIGSGDGPDDIEHVCQDHLRNGSETEPSTWPASDRSRTPGTFLVHTVPVIIVGNPSDFTEMRWRPVRR